MEEPLFEICIMGSRLLEYPDEMRLKFRLLLADTQNYEDYIAEFPFDRFFINTMIVTR